MCILHGRQSCHSRQKQVGAGNGGRFGDIEVQPSTAEGIALYLNCLSALNQHFMFAFLSINRLHLCRCSGHQPRFWKVGNLQLGTKGSRQKPKRVFYGQADRKKGGVNPPSLTISICENFGPF